MIQDYLSDKTIALKVAAEDRYAAIQAVGELLVSDGQITEQYVQEMKDSLDEFGPYIVITKGVAFAHARPGDSVLKECVGMITLDPPVVFGNRNNDPVEVLFAFGGKEANSHVGVLSDIAMVISRDGFLEKMREMTDPADTLAYFCGEN